MDLTDTVTGTQGTVEQEDLGKIPSEDENRASSGLCGHLAHTHSTDMHTDETAIHIKCF